MRKKNRYEEVEILNADSGDVEQMQAGKGKRIPIPGFIQQFIICILHCWAGDASF